MLYYKIDVLEELKKNGHTSYSLIKDGLIGNSGIQKFRDGEMVSTNILDVVCRLTNKQPGDIIGYREEN